MSRASRQEGLRDYRHGMDCFGFDPVPESGKGEEQQSKPSSGGPDYHTQHSSHAATANQRCETQYRGHLRKPSKNSGEQGPRAAGFKGCFQRTGDAACLEAPDLWGFDPPSTRESAEKLKSESRSNDSGRRILGESGAVQELATRD